MPKTSPKAKPVQPESHRIPVEGGTIHAVAMGAGAQTIVLLHGWPQTSAEWLEVMARLADRYRLIAPDLRGCGDSLKAFAGYDATAQSEDITRILNHFAIEDAHVVGHDIGGPVAYAFAATNPERCKSLALFEAPLWGVTSDEVPDLTTLFWHLKFHQDVDLATLLITSNLQAYLDHFYRDFAYTPNAIYQEDAARYHRAYAAPGALRAGLMHYQAIPETAKQLTDLAKTRLAMPVLAYGGSAVMGDYVVKAARLVASNVTGGIIDACGHWVAEERPDFVADAIATHVAGATT
ncbi:alpha/beta fold hydrolase [Roseobacter weihaiensis]|uniref:alpha/beta fold hydrolase n=1 Tax=Roseobacter weihaiensis TaxID=2763262 RepID=UPI001D0A5BC4|nr:alpha/beta hydrolase [Roseobacter sp. H9]